MVVEFKVYKNIEKRYLWNSLWITIVLHIYTSLYITHRVIVTKDVIFPCYRNSMDCIYTFLSIRYFLQLAFLTRRPHLLSSHSFRIRQASLELVDIPAVLINSEAGRR